MKKFKDVEAVDEWLAPFSYEEFFFVIGDYCQPYQTKAECDADIEAGVVDLKTVLEVLKYMARHEIAEQQNLHRREITPWVQLVETH